MHIVWLHIRTIFIFYQSPQSRLRSEYCLSRGCFYWLLSSHHAHNTSFDYQSFPCHGVSGLQDFETEHSLSEEKPKNIIGTIFWFKFLKVWQTRREGKSRGFLNSLTKNLLADLKYRTDWPKNPLFNLESLATLILNLHPN